MTPAEVRTHNPPVSLIRSAIGWSAWKKQPASAHSTSLVSPAARARSITSATMTGFQAYSPALVATFR